MFYDYIIMIICYLRLHITFTFTYYNYKRQRMSLFLLIHVYIGIALIAYNLFYYISYTVKDIMRNLTLQKMHISKKLFKKKKR